MRGLLNTNELNKRALARLAETDFVVNRAVMIFADADNLKTINDHLGHAAGDALIRELARKIAENLGKDALVARELLPDRQHELCGFTGGFVGKARCRYLAPDGFCPEPAVS
ncbi:diguanylate cyclase (GGDEF)-like protein [Yoonia sediminilitoris]|uniref:Diguanylate cyclase (GGDEF)-like protein n=2 Tax=Yoonia sediminilitoris TaxID=1286148 RepID=A0A2T6KFT8_9RHOB|nr:diguanylate cyclase (GGDEF)-like protein [Yoonia sediminilitoris]RCW95124.1 diguanylate cyclase (GGDEF)-like protein [Yoonia sediminilitoris]